MSLADVTSVESYFVIEESDFVKQKFILEQIWEIFFPNMDFAKVKNLLLDRMGEKKFVCHL